MKKAQEKLTEVFLVSMAGFVLLAIVFLSPNGSGHATGSFLQTARGSTWDSPLNWAAAWCSLKVILFSGSLFMLIDSFGTLLLVLNHRRLARKVFIFIVVPFMGLMAGAFYLVKALL